MKTSRDMRLPGNPRDDIESDSYCQVRLNEFFKRPVPKPIRQALQVYREEEDPEQDFEIVSLLTAAPSIPGAPRPLWVVILGSLTTGLLWYGYYKFAVEEELLQLEIDSGKEPRGFGGYGTLGAFTCGILLGLVAEHFGFPGGIQWATLGIIFIYYTQFLLNDRVNELYRNDSLPQPLQVYWCLPIFFPFNLIVGLRQVHFLANYFYRKRGVHPPPSDPVADFFPFIKAPQYTWQEFFLTPSLWCKWLESQPPIDRENLPDPLRRFLALGEQSNTK
jgi:hypothetical protein